ncbi:MAG: hypothetical protein Q8O67_20675 [Deltaproteobacteria bacterium]|nr:hypothetical protein [Deltaproteobacteria bacterium]
MNAIRLAALVAVVASATACPPKPQEASLPPSGLAGVPSSPIPIDRDAAMPAGHPPVGGHGGDDGAPIPVKDPTLPNFGGIAAAPGMEVGGGAGGAGMGAGVVFSGKVLEKLDVPSYTYIRVAVPGGEEWVAISTMSINVGDTVTINQQIVMENFPSKSLNRTFAKLVMGTAVIGG